MVCASTEYDIIELDMISYIISYMISYCKSYDIVHTALAYDIIVCDEVYMISYIISDMIPYCIRFDIILHTI